MTNKNRVSHNSERYKRLRVKKPYSLIKFNFGFDPYPTIIPNFNFWNQLTLQQARFGLHDLDKIIKRNRFPLDKTEYWKQEKLKNIHTCALPYPKPAEISKWWGLKLGNYSPRPPAAIIKRFKKDLDHELFDYEEDRKSLIYPPIFPAKKDTETSRRFKIFFEGINYNGKLRTTGLNLHGTIKELIPYGLKYNRLYDPHQERIISYNDKLPYPEGIKSYSPSQKGNQKHKNTMLRFAYTKTHYKKNQKIKRMVSPPEIIIKCPNCNREKPEHELKRYDTKRHEYYCLFCGLVFEDTEKWSLTPKTSDDYREGKEGQLQATYGNKKYSPEKVSETLYAPIGKPNKTKKGNPHYFRAAKREQQGQLKTNKKAYYSSIDTTTTEGEQDKLKGRLNTKYQDYKKDLEILTDYYDYYKGTSYEIQGHHIQKANERFINLKAKIQDFQGVRPHIKPPRGVNKNVRKNVLLTLLIHELQLHDYDWGGELDGGKLPDFRKKGPGKLIGFNKKVYSLILDKLGLEDFE